MSDLYPARLEQVSPRKGAKHVAILNATIKALSTVNIKVRADRFTLIHKGLYGNTYRVNITATITFGAGGTYSGGHWEAYVPHFHLYGVQLQWVAYNDGSDQMKNMRYLPSILPHPLFCSTPEGMNADDPFGGAADFHPVKR